MSSAYKHSGGNITDTSADITWSEAGTATQWEVYVPATDPAPTAATVGTLVTGTPTYSATSLTSGTIYKVYVRSVCSATDKVSGQVLQTLIHLYVLLQTSVTTHLY
jgi:hypothetical protein